MAAEQSAAVEFFSVLESLVTIGVGIAGVWAAWSALGTWRAQIRGQATFETARKMVAAANYLSICFYAARDVFTDASEFPKDYDRDKRTPESEAAAWRHVFEKRWKRVFRARAKVIALLPETRTFFEPAVYAAAEELLRASGMLAYHMRKYVSLTARGDLGTGPMAEKLEKQFTEAQDAVFAIPPGSSGDVESQDPVTRQFEAAHTNLVHLLRKPLHLE